MKKASVIGYGSIGQRHMRILQDLGLDCVAVTSRSIENLKSYYCIEEMIKCFVPEYIIIANETCSHLGTLEAIRNFGFEGPVLIEKPIFSNLQAYNLSHLNNTWVGYNLRFHPLVTMVKNFISANEILSIDVYVGQYLPTWRENRNYKDTYAVDPKRGGGVLLDLSHEIDYLMWSCGDLYNPKGVVTKISDLEISSEDAVSLTLTSHKVPLISLRMNYLDHIPTRYINLIASDTSLHVNLIDNIYKTPEHTVALEINRDYTYKEQHTDIISGRMSSVCTASEGIKILTFIENLKSELGYYQ